MPQGAIFSFLNYENNSDIINHLLLIFKYYLFKLSLEVLKKEIVKIYNIERRICLNDFKKMRKFRKNSGGGGWGGGGGRGGVCLFVFLYVFYRVSICNCACACI